MQTIYLIIAVVVTFTVVLLPFLIILFMARSSGSSQKQ